MPLKCGSALIGGGRGNSLKSGIGLRAKGEHLETQQFPLCRLALGLAQRPLHMPNHDRRDGQTQERRRDRYHRYGPPLKFHDGFSIPGWFALTITQMPFQRKYFPIVGRAIAGWSITTDPAIKEGDRFPPFRAKTAEGWGTKCFRRDQTEARELPNLTEFIYFQSPRRRGARRQSY